MRDISHQSDVLARSNHAMALWMFVTCGFVVAMIMIGAITRLTDSGLSMVEWRPLIGALPPMSEAEWDRVFKLYQATSEYQNQNAWMDLAEFKTIFFWEWFHRLWGRLIGLVYALPLLVFWVRGDVTKRNRLPLLGLLFLGGFQGWLGWYMVKSGFVDRVDVSHYRLAAHLSVAFLICSALLWKGLDFKAFKRVPDNKLFWHTISVLCVLFVTIIWGAFVAGMDAGLVYNDTFPYMGQSIIPPEVSQSNDLWETLVDQHVGVQFVHRWLAISTVMMVLGLGVHGVVRQKAGAWIFLSLFAACFQLALGIATLMTGVDFVLAVMHQMGAVLLLLSLVGTLRHYAPFEAMRQEDGYSSSASGLTT